MPGPSPMPVGAYDLGSLGYVEEEFVFAGEATSYRLAGERTADGRWAAEPDAVSPYVTRILVRLPTAPTSVARSSPSG